MATRRSFIWLVTAVAVAALALSIPGCGGSEKTNFDQAQIRADPLITANGQFGLDLTSCSTFSIVPLGQELATAISEQKLAWILRGAMESGGYRYVEMTEGPDLVVTLYATTQYATTEVPPRTVSMPVYVPGKISNVQSTISSPWGTSTARGTVSTPGEWTTRSYTRPGRTVGAYYPYVGVSIARGADLRAGKDFAASKVWQGSAVATSGQPMLEIPGQIIMLAMLGKSVDQLQKPSAKQAIGARVLPLTPDGKTLVATVTYVQKGSPADKAGLRLYDLIETINGQPTTNRSYMEIRGMLEKGPVTLSVIRPGGKAVTTVTF
jgi:hypothetical protein